MITRKRAITAIAIGLYLYFLLPATAVVFYELYHLTGVEPVYWGYSAFKIGGYYFGNWEYQLVTCVLVSALILVISTLFRNGRQK